MIAPYTSRPLNHLMAIVFMVLLSVVVACKLVVSQVGSDVVEIEMIIEEDIGGKVELL